ncbi:VPS9 domain-containing protein [Mycena kentingensis (nom. inval.)]|nr:VPS9 domain-containing protein [Mycena kentingensis (nom. inval.)]
MALPPNINITTPTPPRHNSQFRLLYRGSLSLPDSHLLLDGLTFVARVDHPSSGHSLLESPLALALESMRGVQSLRWQGVVNLRDVYLDESAGITMDIHPDAILSRIYFENTFCSEELGPVADSVSGIKVALGDTDGPETTYMLIFARTHPKIAELELVVARITPTPPPAAKSRLPRPDDPTPRRPPHLFKRAQSRPLPHKRTDSVASLGSGVRVGSPPATAFRIPDVPPRPSNGNGKGKERAVVPEDDEDVFGTSVVENKGKRKRASDEGVAEVENQMEKANKTIIKQSAVHLLQLPKTHPDYKDVYGAVYRGVIFALRSEMKRTAVDLKSVERLVKQHMNMYLPADARPAKK